MKIATKLLNCCAPFFAALLLLTLLSNHSDAGDWLTMPSTYSHDPRTGSRIGQFQPIIAPSVPQPINFRSSGFTSTRSTLNFGQSADNYHRVEKWGDPVRPYGEWRFPYRPFSTPYPNWGAPYAGFNLQAGLIPGQGYRPGLPRGGFIGRPRIPGDPSSGAAPIFDSPLNPYPAGGNSPYPIAPYYDGYYPVYRD